MRKFITGSLELICQVAIVLIILGLTISGFTQGFIAGILGLLAGVVISIVTFGALFLLMDIADNTRKTAELLERQSP